MLLEGDKPLRLGSRALDILIALVERAGELVGKDELLARVWPSTFVEEANLRVHVGALRKVLGDGRSGHRYISNVPGRGYCFVADVTRLQLRQSPDAAAPGPRHTDNLPAPLTRMIGRLDTINILAGQLQQRRFVTIVGPGGIGKTTVALAVAEYLVDSYEHRACFLDVASLTDPLLLPSALASALGNSMLSGDPVPSLIAFLRDKDMLLVLDSCERVVEAAAAVAEEVFKHASRVHLLATSREPLRAKGEHVHRLPPLAIPPSSPGLTANDALRFSAVQLFVE
jgi:DNA-binding winged helix-turn-helix (wHTH) protein